MLKLQVHAKVLKKIAGSHKSVILTVIYFGMLLLEELVVEEMFVCRCENATPRAILIISVSTLTIFLFTMGLVQRGEIDCFTSPRKEHEGGQNHENVNDENQEGRRYTNDTPRDSNNSSGHESSGDIDTTDEREQLHNDGTSERESSEKGCYFYHGCICNGKTFAWDLLWSFLGAFLWLTVLTVDGDYMACATTRKPYGEFNCTLFNTTVLPPFSKEYARSKLISRVTGIIITLALLFVGLMIFVACACCIGTNNTESCCRASDHCCCCLPCVKRCHIKASEKLKGNDERSHHDPGTQFHCVTRKVSHPYVWSLRFIYFSSLL